VKEAARFYKVAEMKRAFYKLDKDGSGAVERFHSLTPSFRLILAQLLHDLVDPS
jgi:hypothetical protein